MQPALSASIVWSPAEDTSTVILTTAPPPLDLARGEMTFSPPLSSDDLGTDYRIEPSGAPAIPMIRIDGADSTTSLVALVPLDLTGFDRVESVVRLLSVIHHRIVPADTRLTSQQRARARRMLQAFDGIRSGATQQTIAQVLFGIGNLSRDEWQASSRRHAVMSLLRDARRMIAGGYRKLLRHRHRPRQP